MELRARGSFPKIVAKVSDADRFETRIDRRFKKETAAAVEAYRLDAHRSRRERQPLLSARPTKNKAVIAFPVAFKRFRKTLGVRDHLRRWRAIGLHAFASEIGRTDGQAIVVFIRNGEQP
jgi:hypothetical protein